MTTPPTHTPNTRHPQDPPPDDGADAADATDDARSPSSRCLLEAFGLLWSKEPAVFAAAEAHLRAHPLPGPPEGMEVGFGLLGFFGGAEWVVGLCVLVDVDVDSGGSLTIVSSHARRNTYTQPADRVRRVRAFLDAMAPVLPPPLPPAAAEQEEDHEEEEGEEDEEQLLLSPAIVDGSGGGGIPGERLFAVPLGDMPMPASL